MPGSTGQAAMRQQEPLTHEDMTPLWRWERQMGWFHIGAMGALVLAGVVVHNYGDLAWLRRFLLGAVLVLVVGATVLQFRARCPRCNARVRSKILRMLPDKCAACGVDFPGRPQADA